MTAKAIYKATLNVEWTEDVTLETLGRKLSSLAEFVREQMKEKMGLDAKVEMSESSMDMDIHKSNK